MAKSLPSGKNRYRALILFISIFVLIIVTMLLVNFYFSSQFSKDATKINLAGRQRMLSQRQAKEISNLIQAQSTNKGIDNSFKKIKKTFFLFDTTLSAFTNGGKTQNTDGASVQLEPVIKGSAYTALKEGNEIWGDYRISLKNLIKSDITPLHTLSDAANYAQKYDIRILDSMDKLTKSLVKSNAANRYINLAGRQRMLSQRITKILFELIDKQNTRDDISALLLLLEKDTRSFNTTLNILRRDGIRDGKHHLKPLNNPEALAFLDQGIKLWKPLSVLISNLLKTNTEVFSIIAKANAYANTDNLALLKAMNDLTVSLEQEQSKRSTTLGYIQLIGIALALGMFGFIMMYFMKHLKKTDAQLDQALEETDEILTTIKDGLFLIDQNHIIGQQHSKSLNSIINVEDPAGKDFLTILGKIVPEKTIRVAKEYLDLLYGDRVHADLVGDLNPLDQVEVYFDDEGFEKKLGYLAFNFKRVVKDGGIPHLLVQVEDISRKVILEKQLQETKGAAQEQFDMMLQVLHVQPKVLTQFLQDTEDSLNNINATLRNNSGIQSSSSDEEKLEKIARYMHRIKGDASGLKLTGFEQKAHEFENLFAELKSKAKLTGKDFLPLVIKLEEFLKQLGSLRSMIDKLANLKENLKTEEGDELQIDSAHSTKMSTILNILVNSVSMRQKKNVILNIFNEHFLPENYVKPIHDILTQLVRNSIVHGIESSEIRQKFNKTDEGVIAVKFFKDSEKNLLTMKYLDNGRGLSTADIVKKALQKGIVDMDTAATMTKEEIYSLIFKPGFTTKESAETDAGRGVGMDVVHDLVKKHNGKINIDSVENQIFKIDITLPIVSSKVKIENNESVIVGA